MSRTVIRTVGAIAFVFIGGCSSVSNQLTDIVFIPNANSDKSLKERVEIELAYTRTSEERKQCAGSATAFGFSGGGAAGKIAEIAVEQVSKALKDEAKRYTATYSATAASDVFYHGSADNDEITGEDGAVDCESTHSQRITTTMKFAGFKLTRYVKKHAKAADEIDAISICAIALPTPNDQFFYLAPVAYSMRYSKAKLIAFDMLSPFGVDILNPWEIITDPLTGAGPTLPPADNDIDVTAAVTFDYLHYDKEGKITSTKVGPQSFEVKGARVSGKTTNGYFSAYNRFRKDVLNANEGNYEFTCGTQTTGNDIATLRDQILDISPTNIHRLRLGSDAKLYASAPRETGDDQDNGNFMLTVAVTEFDSYGERIKEINSAFDENKSSIQETLTNILDGE